VVAHIYKSPCVRGHCEGHRNFQLEISKMLIVVFRNKFIVSFIIIFGILSFPMSFPSVLLSLQCFDAVGWAAGRASGL